MKSYCGVVALLGESNAGKSRLMNALLEAPLASVHHKRNLTRERMRAVMTRGERQLVIEDTAGLIMAEKKQSARHPNAHSQPRSQANTQANTQANASQTPTHAHGRDYWRRRMREEALHSAQLADINLWVVDAARGEEALRVAITLAQTQTALNSEAAITDTRATANGAVANASDNAIKPLVFFALNKIDLVPDKRKLLPLAAQLKQAQLCPQLFMLSAKKGDGIASAREHLLQSLPASNFLYESDGDTRETTLIASEITRSVLYDRLHAELPYDARVEGELVSKRDDGVLVIAQRLRLRRESQRRLLLTQEGRLLNTLEQLAKDALQRRFGCPIELALHLPRARDW